MAGYLHVRASSSSAIYACKRFPDVPVRKSSLGVAIVLATASMAAQALPQDGQVTAGQAAINQAGNQLTINQSTAKVVVDWQSFGIAAGEQVTFAQPDSSSVALNRVLGNNASEIFGSLNANGQVFLTNPNGVLFGAGSQVDVGGLVASTLDISNDNFLAGNYTFAGADGGKINNAGNLTAANGGVIALLAPEVINEGVIVAREGFVGLGAGTQVTLSFANGMSLDVDQSALNALIENHLAVRAEGGLIVLSASAQQTLLTGLINNTGALEAGSVSNVGGVIRLTAGYQSLGGEIHADGTHGGEIAVSGHNLDQYGNLTARGSSDAGGSINVDAERLIQVQRGVIDASGTSGGNIQLTMGATTGGALLSGSVLANGTNGNGGLIELTGATPSLTAAVVSAIGGGTGNGGNIHIGGSTRTYVNHATQISVDGGTNGNGGFAIVSSDTRVAVDGHISARGGSASGNGGVAGIVGAELGYAGDVDASAPHGNDGQLVLDSANIDVVAPGTLGSYELLDTNLDPYSLYGGSPLTLANNNVLYQNGHDSYVAPVSGATYLVNAESGALVSVLRGSKAGDGEGGYQALIVGDNNFILSAAWWANGDAQQAGAVTWGSGVTGVNGLISARNSLVGTRAEDHVGYYMKALGNGNYLVASGWWDNGTAVDAGAVTWGNGNEPMVTGTISAANSLVGTTSGDYVGGQPHSGATAMDAVVLANNDYVVRSYHWDNGNIVDAGAVTWGSGTQGIRGEISAANSLVGTSAYDQVGRSSVNDTKRPDVSGRIALLPDGGYVVRSYAWDDGSLADVGAVTWAAAGQGVHGPVSSLNSLIGNAANNQLGSSDIKVLTNGNYVVISPAAMSATWGSGSTGVSGRIDETNSLLGAAPNAVTELRNGNYVLSGPYGATWASGTQGITGQVTSANSLLSGGGTSFVTALANGNYVVASTRWSPGGVDSYGAATWGDGSVGVCGVISEANSLVGTRAGQKVTVGGITALDDGNYVVNSYLWDVMDASGAWVDDVGAVTWGNGTSGTSGVVSAANSLVGSSKGDRVGLGVPSWVDVMNPLPAIVPLTHGGYVVGSAFWDNGSAVDAGAVTWGSSAYGVSGVVNATNSLVGSHSYDFVGFDPYRTSGTLGILALANGNYVVRSNWWNTGAPASPFDPPDSAGTPVITTGPEGAVTWGSGVSGVSGAVSSSNSLVATVVTYKNTSVVVTPLSNGNYVVWSPQYGTDTASQLGALTFGNGETGITGAISSSNSLVGSYPGRGGQWVVNGQVPELANGNYLVLDGYGDSIANVISGTEGLSGVADTTTLSQTAGRAILEWDHPQGRGGPFAFANGDFLLDTNVNLNLPHMSSALTRVSGIADGYARTDISTYANSLFDPAGGYFDVSSRVLPLNGVDGFMIRKIGNAQREVVNAGGRTSYAEQLGWGAFVRTDALSRTLDNGTNVVLRASNDIHVEAPVQGSTANAGDLVARAGHGITLDAAISSSRGDLAFHANDPGVGSSFTVRDTDAADLLVNAAVTTGGDVNMQLLNAHENIDGAMTINAPVTANTITAIHTTDSGITLNAPLTSTATSGVGIEIAAAKFANLYGAGALAAASNRWLVWSQDPANDNRGGLAYDFKQYNAVFDSASVPLGNGRGFLYSLAPVVSPGAQTGTITKVYDGNTDVNGTVSFAADGEVDGDVATVVSASLNYDTPDVGTDKVVAAADASVVAVNGAATVYGYQLGSMPAAMGSITPKPVSAAGITANNKVYDGTRLATVNFSGASADGKILDDDLAVDFSSVTALFDDKNVGTGKTVTVSGLALSGSDAGNYTLAGSTFITTADITRKLMVVAARDEKINYGAPLPVFGYDLFGLVTGDDASVVTGVSLTTTAGENPRPRTYPIIASGGTAQNYQLAYVNGKLNVLGYGTGKDRVPVQELVYPRASAALEPVQTLAQITFDGGGMNFPPEMMMESDVGADDGNGKGKRKQ